MNYYTAKQPIIQLERRVVDADKRSGDNKRTILRTFTTLVVSLAASILSYPLYSIAVQRAASGKKEKKNSHIWSGAWLAALASGLSNGIYFVLHRHNPFHSSLIQAVFAASVNVIITNPMWVIITRMQASKIQQTFLVTAKKLIKSEGYIGFYDGLTMNLIMTIYPTVRQVGLEASHSIGFNTGHAMKGLQGMAASCFATIVTYPIQRWRIQQQLHKQCTTTGLFDGLTYKILHSGMAAFILFAFMSASDEILDSILG